MTGLRLSYLVPVYNEELTIPDTTKVLVERLAEFSNSEVVLIENGSTDASPALVEDLARTLSGPHVRVVAAHSDKGVGNALRTGMQLASGDLWAITAADLPFGFSDLDQVLSMDPRPALVIGSKAHPQSRIGASAKRRLMSSVFRQARELMLGLGVGDTQGTVFIDGALGRRIVHHLQATDYFVTTELIAFATRFGVEPIEVPVDYQAPRSGSKVRPVRDGTSMALALFDLRRRLARDAAGQIV
ncbi:MAG: glycosyltransferase [Acidimicrobiia bacterium]